MINIINALLVWLFVPMMNAFFDRKGAKRNYWVVNILRGACLIFHGSMFVDDYQSGWKIYPVLVFQFTSFWLVFDELWNKYNNRPFLYYDMKEGDSGIVDRLFKWVGPKGHAVAKGLALIACVCSVIYIFKHADNYINLY